jgi:hypothetical protein
MKIGVMTPGGGAAVGSEKKKAAAARAKVVLEALKQKLPADLRFENAPLTDVSARLSDALSMKVELTCKDPYVKAITMDFGGLTLQAALQTLSQREGTPGPWRLAVGPKAGDAETPTIAIMVGPNPGKKR